jgi:hypothetical protein
MNDNSKGDNMKMSSITQTSSLVSALALFAMSAPGCTNAPSDGDTAETDQASTTSADDDTAAPDQSAAIIAPGGASPQLVTCTTHKGNTAGWIVCTGSGTVRLVIDCSAPQITDFVGPYTTYSGSVTLSGECNFGINSVTYQAK